jgi:hypothetical protein
MTKFKGLLEATKIHRPDAGEEGFSEVRASKTWPSARQAQSS